MTAKRVSRIPYWLISSESHTVRSRLTRLVFACVIPVWLASGGMLYYSYQAKRAISERHMIDTAHALSMLIDKEFSRIQSVLQVLATSPELSSQNLSLFHTHVKEVLKTFPGADIVMADRTGQQIINSYKNFGDVLPVRNVPDIVNQVFETGKPQISGIFYGAVSKRPLIGIDVPVIQGDRVIYDLAMTFPPDRVRDILLRGNLPNDWLGFILDPACCMEAA